MIIIQTEALMEYMAMVLSVFQLISLIINILFKERKKDAHAKIQSVLNYIVNVLLEVNTVARIAIVEIVKIIVKMNQ